MSNIVTVESLSKNSIIVTEANAVTHTLTGKEVEAIAPTLKLGSQLELLRNEDGSVKSLKIATAVVKTEKANTGSRGRSPAPRANASALPR